MNEAWRSMNPLRCSGTDLPPNLLLMAKILVVGLALKGYWGGLPEVFLPMVPILEALDPAVFRRVLQAGFAIAGAALLLNLRVRVSCMVLGLVFLLAIAASLPYYRNATVYAGCILLLAGLSKAGERPWLLSVQISLLYLGAGWNKLFEPDWRNGQYFEHWMIGILTNPYYEAAASLLPPMMLSMTASWLTILIEIFVGLAVLHRRSIPAAILVASAFHVIALLATHQDFGIFFIAICASFLALVDWPAEVTVRFDPAKLSGRLIHRLRMLDFDRLIDWEMREGPLEIAAGDRVLRGVEALKRMLLLLPATTLFLAILLTGPKWVRWGTAAGALLFFVPWRVSFSRRGTGGSRLEARGGRREIEQIADRRSQKGKRKKGKSQEGQEGEGGGVNLLICYLPASSLQPPASPSSLEPRAPPSPPSPPPAHQLARVVDRLVDSLLLSDDVTGGSAVVADHSIDFRHERVELGDSLARLRTGVVVAGACRSRSIDAAGDFAAEVFPGNHIVGRIDESAESGPPVRARALDGVDAGRIAGGSARSGGRRRLDVGLKPWNPFLPDHEHDDGNDRQLEQAVAFFVRHEEILRDQAVLVHARLERGCQRALNADI